MLTTNYLRVLSILAAMVALVAVLVLWGARPAEAAFPGKNGKIVFDSFLPGQADSEIVTLSYNPNGGPVPEDPDPQLTDNTAPDSGAAWSPNGKRIAFERNSDIWVMNADGTNQTRLTNNAIIDSNPTWSPNGKKIAFVSERDGDLDIWAMKPVPEGPTNVPQNLTNDPVGAFDSDPAWSPLLADGSTRVAFHRNGDVWTVNPANLAKQQITTEPTGSDSFPNWSPNGRRIVFQSNRNTVAFPNTGNDQEIYTIKAVPETDSTGTNEPRRLTDNTARDEAPAWSPEGSHIAFMSNRRDNNLEIWVMSTLSDDNAVRLTNNRGIDEYPD
jgi:Tol biopolymer transport system component